MIPKTETDLRTLEIKTQPSLTYGLDIENGRVRGRVDGLAAVRQAVHLILNTDRFAHLIHSWNYGSEHRSTIGKPREYAIPEIKRHITEALLQDDRITAVDGFEFSVDKKVIHVDFVVHSIFGETEGSLNV